MSGMVFCRACGAEIHESAPFCPNCGAPQRVGVVADPDDRKPRTFANSIAICLNRYATFRGRAPRAEFWYFTLFVFLVGLGARMVDAVWLQSRLNLFAALVDLGFLLPGLAVAVRRLHDLDRSGWWYLLVFVPLLGWLVLFVWYCTRGIRGDNRFGVDPLAG